MKKETIKETTKEVVVKENKKLSPDEAAIILDLDRASARMKIELATLVIQIENANLQKMSLVQRIMQHDDGVQNKLKEMIAAHGGDPKRPWKLDFSTMQFEEAEQTAS